jgi:hypothetical protein
MSLFDNLPELDRDRTKALEAVEAICKGAGWTVERVGFGDDVDLKVGIPSGCELPNVPLWIGIEAKRNLTQFRKGGTHYSLPLRSKLVERSLARREPTIFVLWNLERRSGLWGSSTYVLQELELLLGEERPSFVFHDEFPFSVKAADPIMATARLERCSTLLARHLDQTAEALASLPEDISVAIAAARLRLFINALQVLGFWQDGLSELAIETFHRERLALLESVGSGDDEPTVEEIDSEAVVRMVAVRIGELTDGQVAGRDLIDQLPALLEVALQEAGEMDDVTDPEE